MISDPRVSDFFCLCKNAKSMQTSRCSKTTPLSSQVSPEILTQDKNPQIAASFLEDNFENFRVLTASKNMELFQLFLDFGLKCCEIVS